MKTLYQKPESLLECLLLGALSWDPSCQDGRLSSHVRKLCIGPLLTDPAELLVNNQICCLMCVATLDIQLGHAVR